MTTLDPVDAALAAAVGVGVDGEVDGEVDGDGPGGLLGVDELAAAADTPVAVIEAIEREGLLVPRTTDPLRFARSDVETIRAAMATLATGLPLGEFLDLARRADEALRGLAAQAVDTFLLYVRDPVRGNADDPELAADELVGAFEAMLPAVRGLVGGHFQALVLAEARDRLGRALATTADHPAGASGPDRDGAADGDAGDTTGHA